MGRILVIEFSDHETTVFKEIVRVLIHFSDFENLKISDECLITKELKQSIKALIGNPKL